MLERVGSLMSDADVNFMPVTGLGHTVHISLQSSDLARDLRRLLAGVGMAGLSDSGHVPPRNFSTTLFNCQLAGLAVGSHVSYTMLALRAPASPFAPASNVAEPLK